MWEKGVQEFKEKELGARIQESGGVWYDHTEEVNPSRRLAQPSVSGFWIASPLLELLNSFLFRRKAPSAADTPLAYSASA
jgi:hypothetical protein